MNSPTPAFDANNIDSIQAAMRLNVPPATADVTADAVTSSNTAVDGTIQENKPAVVQELQEVKPTVDAVEEDGWTDDEVLQATVRFIREYKTTDEIKAALDESYEGIPDVDELIDKAAKVEWGERFDAEQAAKAAADALIDPRVKVIKKLKKEVEMVLSCLHEDSVDDVELLEIDEGADLDEQIRILNENLSILYKAVKRKPIPPDVKKFGKFNGPITSVHVEGPTPRMWIDVDGVDIYTGLQVKMTPWVQGLIDEACERFTDEWLEEEQAKKEANKTYQGDGEYPVRILPEQPGPSWNDKILYGIAGDIVRRISANCEAHPAGMLTDFLVSFGNMIGRGPYFSINETEHYTNEFMVRVGDSSKSRKGTGRDVIDKVLKQVDPAWYSNRVTSGFGSAEAIINQIKDSSMETRQVTVKGVKVSEQFLNRGVEDKRLYVRDGEIASLFVLADKKESFASVVLRQAWDGKALRNIVKGRTAEGLSNSAKCEQPHLSISGDTTIHELRVKMPKGADENGFGNRFLFVYVYRVKECPNGGPPLDWSKEVVQLCQTLQWARTVKHVSMTNAARQWWFDNYHGLEHDGPEGQAAKMTARAPAHLRRIAMIYALLDKSDQIDTRHFQAAKRLWDYCSESAVFIFGGATAEQLRIQNWIGLRQTATYKQVRDELYQRNKPCRGIKADLAALVGKNMLHLVGDVYSKKGV